MPARLRYGIVDDRPTFFGAHDSTRRACGTPAEALVTLVFRASVEVKSGAYAAGVLVLILSAALAVTLATGNDSPGRPPRGGPG